jgi:hypothetical protein
MAGTGPQLQSRATQILELRNRAKQQLGPRFDLKVFHDKVLSGGSLPLDMLGARINSWITGQQIAAHSPSAICPRSR